MPLRKISDDKIKFTLDEFIIDGIIKEIAKWLKLINWIVFKKEEELNKNKKDLQIRNLYLPTFPNHNTLQITIIQEIAILIVE